MAFGIVKFYNEKNGFGFIKDTESGREIYVRSSGLLEPIKENDRVSFNLADGKKGLIAIDVKKTENQ
jgi:CspA family cold shock protein